MIGVDLARALRTLEVSQLEFARMIGVPASRVGVWIRENHDVPGPVAAYVRLLVSLPPHTRSPEILRGKMVVVGWDFASKERA